MGRRYVAVCQYLTYSQLVVVVDVVAEVLLLGVVKLIDGIIHILHDLVEMFHQVILMLIIWRL